MITSTTVYRTKGKQFERFEEAVTHRENLVEEFLRKTPGYYDVPLKMRQEFVQSILGRRTELRDLLNYSDKMEDEDEN